MKDFRSTAILHEKNQLKILDQTLLPSEEKWLKVNDPEILYEAIQSLRVRGAPLIGVAAALGIARYAEDGASLPNIKKHIERLKKARPTAVNLTYALERLAVILSDHEKKNTISIPRQARDDKRSAWNDIVLEAEKIFDEDVDMCEKMGTHGSKLINDGDRILTHCNAGALATAGRGTAVGVITKAWELGRKIHVYVDETRPLLQGARLTAWELSKLNIPHTLICDNMAASLMGQKKIDKIFVGADRIARNGDFANKIGTYGVAVLAKFHNIPFYVVSPQSTIDPSIHNGSDIPIEIRNSKEVSQHWNPTHIYNPSFDVTPTLLVTAYVLDSGVHSVIPKEITVPLFLLKKNIDPSLRSG
ncbi:MAG: S-methyl-5-thioribose-1-phosphate isomerase [Deltaproteobacteria bacterium]|nr:S-methyl-5-thioribose-1-phosphate isomerase [Deltaproteobacteria bacterium]